MTITDRLAEGQRETLAAGHIAAPAMFTLRENFAADIDERFHLVWPNIEGTGCCLTVLSGSVSAILAALPRALAVMVWVDAAADDDAAVDVAAEEQIDLNRILRDFDADDMPVRVLLDGAPLDGLDMTDLVERIAARREAGA